MLFSSTVAKTKNMDKLCTELVEKVGEDAVSLVALQSFCIISRNLFSKYFGTSAQKCTIQ